MYDEKMSRRDFLLICGTMGGIIAGGVAFGSLIHNEGDKRKKENIEKMNEENWTPTGNQTVFPAYTHFPYEYKAVDGEEKITAPNGYKCLNNEAVFSAYNTSNLKAMKYYFVNEVEVVATEYINDKGEYGYPHPGTPLIVKKEDSKIFKKTL